MGRDRWIDEGGEVPIETKPDLDALRMRIRCHYNYSDVERFKAMLTAWQKEVIKELVEWNKLKHHLDQM